MAIRILERLTSVVRVLGDIAFPPSCPSCRAHVTAEGNFCPACFEKLRLISAPMCACCGIPFVVAIGEDARCPECLENPPAFSMARAVMVYDAVSAPLVSALKFHDQWAGFDRYAQMMSAAGSGLLKDADVLIPVPLHWRRLLTRKFNQSAVLAYGVSAASGVACAVDILKRVRPTKPQMRLDRKERAANVKRAFAVEPAAEVVVKGKVIVLVDDVVTTGATANACAKALLKAGANEVRILSLARTVKE